MQQAAAHPLTGSVTLLMPALLLHNASNPRNRFHHSICLLKTLQAQLQRRDPLQPPRQLGVAFHCKDYSICITRIQERKVGHKASTQRLRILVSLHQQQDIPQRADIIVSSILQPRPRVSVLEEEWAGFRWDLGQLEVLQWEEEWAVQWEV